MLTKTSVKKTIINLIAMVTTYLIFNLISKRSLSNIDWDMLIVMSLAFVITSLILSGRIGRNKNGE